MNKLKFLLLTVVILATATLSFQGRPSVAAAQAATGRVCKFDFEATVREGPSKGTALVGSMTLNIDKDGSFTGELTAKDGKKTPVTGQVQGRAINLIFELEPMTDKSAGKYIFGNGTALKPIMADDDCGGPLGGTFTGPNAADIGTWIKVTVCLTVGGHTVCASVEVTA